MTAYLMAALICAGNFAARDFGARADGTTVDTAALQGAVDACSAAGGGRVVLDQGRFLCGSLVLRSGVTLTIRPAATLLGSRNLTDYANRRLLSATDATNIALDGGGTIDGQGSTFWEQGPPYAGPDWRGTAQFEYKALARPSFVHLLRCVGVKVSDVKLVGAPSWTLHLQRCRDVSVDRVTIRNPLHGPNTDGIDVNSCEDVSIDRCDIITGDDGVVLKSTEPGHDHPSRRISVTNCRIQSACNALKIGTETHDSFEHITFADCQLYAEPGARLLDRAIAGLAIESVDGAELSDIQARRLTMDYVRTPLFIRLGHRGGNSPRTQQVEPRVPGRIRDVVIEQVRATHASFTSSINGLAGHPVERVSLRDIDLSYDGGGSADLVTDDVPDDTVKARYPEAHMFGLLPAYGLYCRHVDGLILSGLRCPVAQPDARPMLVADDVRGLRAEGCVATDAGEYPAYWLLNTPDAHFATTILPRRVYAESSPGVTLDGGEVTRGEPGALVAARLPLVREQSPGRVELTPADFRLTPPMVLRETWLEVPSGRLRDQGAAGARLAISVAGEYEVWVRGMALDGQSDSFYLSLGRQPRCDSDWLKPVGIWAWDRVRARLDDKVQPGSAAVFTLAAGESVLRLSNRESGMRVQRVVVVRRELAWQPPAD